jgi:hypothetical protein
VLLRPLNLIHLNHLCIRGIHVRSAGLMCTPLIQSISGSTHLIHISCVIEHEANKTHLIHLELGQPRSGIAAFCSALKRTLVHRAVIRLQHTNKVILLRRSGAVIHHRLVQHDVTTIQLLQILMSQICIRQSRGESQEKWAEYSAYLLPEAGIPDERSGRDVRDGRMQEK